MGSFKNGLLQNHRAKIAHIYVEAFCHNVDSKLFTSMSLGSECATIEKIIFRYIYIEKRNLFQKQQANFNKIW
jgi:hypothetical protein